MNPIITFIIGFVLGIFAYYIIYLLFLLEKTCVEML
jgi:hypothetical protein